MTFANQMRSHQSRCRPQLLRLRMLARSEADAVLCGQVIAEIRDATNAIIAEAEAMSFAALGDGGRRGPEAETFLWARLTRLATTADQAVNAASSGDVCGLRAHMPFRESRPAGRAAMGMRHPRPGGGYRSRMPLVVFLSAGAGVRLLGPVAGRGCG
jgi:hypothetical protein